MGFQVNVLILCFLYINIQVCQIHSSHVPIWLSKLSLTLAQPRPSFFIFILQFKCAWDVPRSKQLTNESFVWSINNMKRLFLHKVQKEIQEMSCFAKLVVFFCILLFCSLLSSPIIYIFSIYLGHTLFAQQN